MEAQEKASRTHVAFYISLLTIDITAKIEANVRPIQGHNEAKRNREIKPWVDCQRRSPRKPTAAVAAPVVAAVVAAKRKIARGMLLIRLAMLQ